MLELIKSVSYIPLYNVFIYLLDQFPTVSAGVLVIIFTICIKIVLLPLARKAFRVQQEMKKIQPDLALLQKEKISQQEKSLKMMEIYKKHDISPLSSLSMIGVVLVQIPILFSLYYIFRNLPEIQTDILYSFVQAPEQALNMMFFGVSITQKKVILMAILTALSQAAYAFIATPKPEPKKETSADEPKSLQDEIQRSMAVQMKYVLPVIIGVTAYSFPLIVSLYWVTSNIFSIGQELVFRKLYVKN
jgi:YidC/Oxa1 family membrane protein insertase